MMWSYLLRDGCWKTFDLKLVISGGVVLNQVDSPLDSLLKPHLLLVQRIPRGRENGVRELCWSVGGPLLGLQRHRRLIVLSTRKWQTNCSLPRSLQNNVTARALFAANFQISFGLKNGGGFNSCRAVQEALSAGVESNMITVRGHELKVSIEKSQRQRTTLSNMHRAAAFLRKSGVSSESYLLSHKSSRILSTMTKEDLGVVLKTTGCDVRNVNFACCPGMCRGSQEA